jgi:tetratricopeptide (TPR) repeat protein
MEGHDSIRSIFESVGLTGSETESPSRFQFGDDAGESSRLGRECMKDGDFRGAQTHFERAIKQGAPRGEAYLNLGSSQEAGELPEEAFESYKTSFEFEPSVEAAVAASYALRALGRRREAMAWLEKGAGADPESSFPYRRMAEIAMESREYSAAARAAQKAAEISADDAETHLWASGMLLDAGHPAEALAAAQSAQNLKPMSAEPILNQALALACMNRLPEAVRLIQLARDLEPHEGLPAVMASIFDPEQTVYELHPFDAQHLVRLVDRPGMEPRIVQAAQTALQSSQKDV